VLQELDTLGALRTTAESGFFENNYIRINGPFENNYIRTNTSNSATAGHAYVLPAEIFSADESSPNSSQSIDDGQGKSDDQPKGQCCPACRFHNYSAPKPASRASWTNVSSHPRSMSDDRVVKTKSDSDEPAEDQARHKNSRRA
jgi:hypothetical protein